MRILSVIGGALLACLAGGAAQAGWPIAPTTTPDALADGAVVQVQGRGGPAASRGGARYYPRAGRGYRAAPRSYRGAPRAGAPAARAARPSYRAAPARPAYRGAPAYGAQRPRAAPRAAAPTRPTHRTAPAVRSQRPAPPQRAYRAAPRDRVAAAPPARVDRRRTVVPGGRANEFIPGTSRVRPTPPTGSRSAAVPYRRTTRPVHQVRRPPGAGYRRYAGGRFHRVAPRWIAPRRYWNGYWWRQAGDGWYYWYDDIWWLAPAFGVIAAVAIADLAAGDRYVDEAAAPYAPWTPEWYAWCARRYRSFDPNTGYYLGYDGEYHFCVYRG